MSNLAGMVRSGKGFSAGRRVTTAAYVAGIFLALSLPAWAGSQIQWLNHLELLPGDPTVTSTQFQQHPSFGTNVEGLVITSSTTGDIDSNNEDKFVSMALVAPKETKITGVRLCYELSNPGATGSFIEDIRLAQFNNTDASTASVLLDDSTVQDASGPTCVTSKSPLIFAGRGTIVLSLRTNFASTSDQIVVRALGLLVK